MIKIDVKAFDAAEYLDDEAVVSEYLNAALEIGNDDAFLQAVSDVARARGMAQLARDTGLGRESLYKTLAPGAKPRWSTISQITKALGVSITFSSTGQKKHTV